MDQVFALSGSRRTSSASPKEHREHIIRIGRTSAILHTLLAILIVQSSLIRIRESLVGMRNLLELLRVATSVRVLLES
jgi:hypothetical protein